jgi:hypothetical protein
LSYSCFMRHTYIYLLVYGFNDALNISDCVVPNGRMSWLVSWLVGWLVGWLVYFSCSNLEHRVSVKRFVSLQFLNLRQSVRVLGRGISPSQNSYLTQTQNKHKQTSLPRLWFEPIIKAFERAKTVHTFDRAATEINSRMINEYKFIVTGSVRGLWIFA